MPFATLEEKRLELAVRLGFAASGASAGVLATNLNSILQNAQVILYNAHDWARLRKYSVKSIGVGQYLVDYPTDANPERIKAISPKVNGQWLPPLVKGITPQMYTTQASQSYPQRWEPYEQIELWPQNNEVRDIRIFYIKNLDPITQNAHRFTIDSDLVFTLALGDAKAHYRQPDAPAFVQRAQALLASLKSKSWGKDVFNPSDWYEEDSPLVKPQVV